MPSSPLTLLWFRGHLSCPFVRSAWGNTSFSFLRIVKVTWLVLRSRNLRGKDDKNICTLDQTLRLWTLSQTPQLPKSESASKLNDCPLVQMASRISEWWSCREGGAMKCDHQCPSLYATFKRTGLKGSTPHQLPTHLSSLPSSLPCSFAVVLWDPEKWNYDFFSNVDWSYLNLLHAPHSTIIIYVSLCLSEV